ncbi:mRNA 3' end processing factor [Penicillium ochrochloron]
MSGLVSDEVAEDYKSSLEDLTGNDRFQISNLTVIAKENTEHAMAISRVLENHIRSTPPQQKLPALYVVDSIVKNVGTPYTLFLGRNMYQTFMNAYTLVDAQTRRKLDEMLKTWKEPVPGSLDTRPVFPPEITRSIESALIKARTAALQQEQARGSRDILNRVRNTGTPPGMSRQVNNHHGTNGQGYGTPTPPQGHRPASELEALNRDLEACILSARNDFAAAPFDPTTQQRLKALLDLQTIMRNQQLTPDQLRLVRDQLSAFRPQAPVAQNPAPSAPPPAAAPIPPPAPVPTPPSQPPSQALQNLLNSRTLAELIKNTAIRQQPTPPPAIPNVMPQMPSMPQMPQMPPVSNTPQPENPLIAALRSRGILPPASAPPVMGSTGQPPTENPLPFLMPGGMRSTPPAPTPPVSMPVSSTVPMNTASMKIPRVALVVSLYEAKSNRCGTCGRRFPTTQEGKEKKARHLDWHFKTNQRMSEAAKRAQTRSWYVDERDWIKSREVDDDQPVADTDATTEGGPGAEGNASKQGPPKAWIRAPNDATLRNTPCPICQEKFESTWSEDVQDWIWEDAIKVGARVYHASCYAEVTKDGPAPRSSTPQARTGTPDSVLGKRKAEGNDSPGGKTRIKTEA